MATIYTRDGDGGVGELLFGGRVPKCDPRMVALGDVDELNSHLGLLIAHLPRETAEFEAELRSVQGELMAISGRLAVAVPRSPLLGEDVSEDPVRALERRIDAMSSELDGQTGFVLPGGHVAAAQAHVARTVCRRCERSIVALGRQQSFILPDDVLAPVVVYLNRLSDYLFVLAGLLNHRTGVAERRW
jgi:cob(I)alamin adenosyltransferase